MGKYRGMSRSSTNEYYYIPGKTRSRFPGVVFWRVNGPLPCTPSERDGLSDSLRLLGTLYPLSPLKRSSSVLDTRSSPLSSPLQISDNTSLICLGGSVSGMGFGEPVQKSFKYCCYSSSQVRRLRLNKRLFFFIWYQYNESGDRENQSQYKKKWRLTPSQSSLKCCSSLLLRRSFRWLSQ